jgi:transcriptional regulator with XRE-family HTH domain
MARAAVGMGIRELAKAAKVSIDTVVRFEKGEELKERTVEALQRALEVAGVEFTNGERPGVHLRRQVKPDNDIVQRADSRKGRPAEKVSGKPKKV